MIVEQRMFQRLTGCAPVADAPQRPPAQIVRALKVVSHWPGERQWRGSYGFRDDRG